MTVVLFVAGLVVVHELAHAATATALGLRWEWFVRLPWKAGVRVEVRTAAEARLVGVAGPAANLLAGVALFASGWAALGVLSVLLGTVASLSDWRIVLARPTALDDRLRVRRSHSPLPRLTGQRRAVFLARLGYGGDVHRIDPRWTSGDSAHMAVYERRRAA